jgi:PKD repeat protein
VLLSVALGYLTEKGLAPHGSPLPRRYMSRRAWALSLTLVLTFCSNPAGNVSTPGAAPEAAFTVRCADMVCTFTDGSSDADRTIVTRNWDFGDGATSAEVNPEHTYVQSGTYSVSLRVVDDSGAASSTSQSVVVQDVSNVGVVFMGAGDIADCSSGAEDAATAALIAQYPAALVFTLGDNAYSDGTPDNYSQCYAPTWGQFKDRTRPTPGNHDYHTSGAAGYFGYFGAVAGPSGRGYYSYDLGSWHIISLNSEIDVSAASEQAAWLEQDLATHPATCTLAYWHRPLFTSGAVHPPEVAMRPLFTILYDGGADIVLSGHNHQYERFAPQRPDGTADVGAGVRYFVAGTGGAGLYDFATAQPNSQVRYKGYGVLKLTLGATNYAWEFVPVAGSSFTDDGTGDCH